MHAYVYTTHPRSQKTAARVKDTLSLEDEFDQNDDTDTDTSILLYNLVRRYFPQA